MAQTLSIYQSDLPLLKTETHSAPKRKTPNVAILVLSGSCNFRRTGIGSATIRMSETKSETVIASQNLISSTQYGASWDSKCVQKADEGVHWNTSPKVKDIVHPIITAIQILINIRNHRTVKIRLYKVSSDNFVQPIVSVADIWSNHFHYKLY